MVLGDFLLPPFHRLIVELDHMATGGTHQMVVMGTRLEFINGLAGLELMALQQPGLNELRQHTIDGREADIAVLFGQQAMDIVRRQVTPITITEQFENSNPLIRRLQPQRIEFFRIVAHRHQPLEFFAVAQITPLPKRQITEPYLAHAHTLKSNDAQADQFAHATNLALSPLIENKA